jgi:hypothetical protein
MTDRELMQKILSFLETNYLVMCSQFHAQKDTLADDLRKQLAQPIQWQGLTDEERNQFRQWAHPEIIDAIELKLRERNP